MLFWSKENGADATAEALNVAYKAEQLFVSATEQMVMVALPAIVPPVKVITLPLLMELALTALGLEFVEIV